jgi:predicted peptidase
METSMNVRFPFLFALLSIIVTACSTTPPLRETTGHFMPREVVVDGAAHGYQVFVPAKNAGGKHPPMILFLHGSGERGSDNLAQLNAGIGPYLRKHADDFPAIVVLPQVPEHGAWMGENNRVALAALDAATREFGGDANRTYLTGLSMGGYGTWEIATQQPQRFAAIAPICGALQPPPISEFAQLRVTSVTDAANPYAALATRMHGKPIWIFHGAKDDVVPPDDDRKTFAALKTADGDVHYTEFPDANHNAWDPAYNTPEFWKWLFAQKLQ